jgi:hypothetical protein
MLSYPSPCSSNRILGFLKSFITKIARLGVSLNRNPLETSWQHSDWNWVVGVKFDPDDDVCQS